MTPKTVGYSTRELALEAIAALPAPATGDRYLILRVVGEYRIKSQLVEVIPA